MAKIEERAMSLYPTDSNNVEINRMNAYKRLGYLCGATEQLTIDIANAKQFAKKWLDEIIQLWLPDLKDEPYYSAAVQGIYNKLVKAMKNDND